MHYMAITNFTFYYMLNHFTVDYICFHAVPGIYTHYMLNSWTQGNRFPWVHEFSM